MEALAGEHRLGRPRRRRCLRPPSRSLAQPAGPRRRRFALPPLQGHRPAGLAREPAHEVGPREAPARRPRPGADPPAAHLLPVHGWNRRPAAPARVALRSSSGRRRRGGPHPAATRLAGAGDSRSHAAARRLGARGRPSPDGARRRRAARPDLASRRLARRANRRRVGGRGAGRYRPLFHAMPAGD